MRGVLRQVARSLTADATVDDLGAIMPLWRAQVDRLLPGLGDAYLGAAAAVRARQRDALVRVLGGRALTAGPGAGGGFEIPPVRAELAEQLMANARNRLVNVGNEAWELARGELLAGMQAGEGVRELAARVSGASDLVAPRTELIARTEVGHAMNQGSLEQMRQIGLPATTKTWIAVEDARTRPEHAEADGETVKLDDQFSIGEEPGDAPNCRCTLGFDVPDDQFAEAACGCDDALLASAAPALTAGGGDELDSVCACGTSMGEDELRALAVPPGDSGMVAPEQEFKETERRARAKISAAPTPSAEAVGKAQQELENARKGTGRAGGEARGGSAAARRRQRLNLFNEFGGQDRGYAVCHGCGTKIHWATPGTADNPQGYARFERGKIFVKCQGGGYQLANLLPECFACNRTRGDRALRDENGC